MVIAVAIAPPNYQNSELSFEANAEEKTYSSE